MTRGKAVAIVLSDAERDALEQRVRRRKSSHGAGRRARIVPLAADGLSNTAIAEKLGVSRLALGIAQEGDLREGGSLFGPGVQLEPIPGLREVGEYHLPTVLVGKRRGCISKIVHALPPRMVGGASTDTVAPALRRAFTRSRRSPPPVLAKHGTTAVRGIASATPRCAGVPAARSGKQSGIRPDAQDGTRRPACARPSHRNRLSSASRCAACFP